MFMDEGHHGNGSGPATRDRRPRGVPAGALFHARLHDADAVRYRHEVPLPPFVPLTWTWASPGSASPTPTLLAEQLGEAARQLGARLRRHQDDLAAALTAAVERGSGLLAEAADRPGRRRTRPRPGASRTMRAPSRPPEVAMVRGDSSRQPREDRPDGAVQDGKAGRPGAGRHLRRRQRRRGAAGRPGRGGGARPGRLAVADVRGHHRLVPAFRATGPDLLEGGLRLANP